MAETEKKDIPRSETRGDIPGPGDIKEGSLNQVPQSKEPPKEAK